MANNSGGRLILIDTFDSMYSACRYSVMSSLSCAEDPGDVGTLLVHFSLFEV